MENELSLLIVEDDPVACSDFVKYIENYSNINLIGITNSSIKAIEYIKNNFPDAVVLDLELHNGYGNGLLVLQELTQLSLDLNPFVLVTTNNSSLVTYDCARQLGADFIMTKHQADYSAKYVIDFLNLMTPSIKTKKTSISVDLSSSADDSQTKQKRIKRKLKEELNIIGISPKAVGYQYLIDAIILTMNQPTRNICTIIGEQYKKTDASIERAMQNAINKAWRTSNIEDLLNNYTARISSERGVPTLMEFIYFYANKAQD